MGTIWHDLQQTCSTLWKIPTFTVAAVLTLALGIGPNTVMFSVIETVLLRPLPYKDASNLVQLWNTYPPMVPQGANSAGDYRDFRQRTQTLSGMSAYIDTPRGLNLTGDGEPERVEARYATSGLFPLLGIEPVAGHGFTSEQDNPGSPLVVLISHDLWQNHFGSNPGVVGGTLTLDGRGYTVVGVLPEHFRLASTTDVWMPIGLYNAGPDPYRYHEFNIIGRRKPGMRIDQVQAELTTLNRQQQQALPDTHRNFGVLVTAMQDALAAKMRRALLVLFGAVAFVLLVACANFVNLLMARNAARQQEIAIRVALGANRKRLLNLCLTESVLLSLGGGAVGVLLAQSGLRVLRMLIPPNIAVVRQAGLNIWVLVFTLSVSFLAGIVCGVIPALQAQKTDVQTTLKEGTRTAAASRGRTARHVLVVSEIALAIVPLTGAGLLIRSLDRLLDVNPGFRRDHILTLEVDKAQLSLDEQNKLTSEQRINLLRQDSVQYDGLIQRLQALPGVTAAGGISVLPLAAEMRSASRFLVEGQPVPADGVRPVAETRNVSPGYFVVMGIPLRTGRSLDAHDFASQNIVVNEALAEKFWPSADAIGKRINFCSLAPEPCWTTIVGVVGNVHQYGLEAAATFDSYGNAGWTPYTVVRTTSDPDVMTQAIIQEIHRFDPNLPVTHVMTLDHLLAESIAPRRFSTFLLGLFAGLALLLAMIGVYAVMSHAVRIRTNEIGMRMALGARPQSIWWLILGNGARLVFLGIAIGLAGAFALSKLISTLLYGVTSTDPITFTGVALLLASVAMGACYLPARQAMRIDPMAALRL